MNPRIGIGHDTHRFETLDRENPTHTIRLGGVDVPYSRRLLGHSDADVLLHAVTDALLGAAGLGDIGEHFPDTSEENRGRDSTEILAETAQKIAEKNYNIINIDSIIFAQEPRLGPYKAKMAEKIAEILQISTDCVNVKAKTGENVGFIGRTEAISAEAAVLLDRLQK